jgi:isopentenyl diphosphate isomerase/L-lactate dehydrogenase-like FMN-dependent dehydrogenase
MPRPSWLSNPWARNPWFETVAVAQSRAKKRLPWSVYGALLAGSERGVSANDNTAAFAELGFAPHIAGQKPERHMNTTVMGLPISLPVVISPTGVQAVHPQGEVAVARAAAARGTVIGLSNFASKSIEEVVEANPNTFFQMYWTGNRDVMIQRMDRARAAGAKGLIATLDWSFSMGRDWGSPEIPEKVDLRTAVRFAPQVLARPWWLWEFGRTGRIPDLTAPNLAPPDGPAPTFFGAYYEWMTTPPPTWEDVEWMRKEWNGPFLLKGVCRIDDANAPSTQASTPSPCPTTGATTSTAHPPPSACCTRSSQRSVSTSTSCSTAVSAAAPTWSKPSPSALAPYSSAAPPSGAWPPTAKQVSRTSWTSCAAASTPHCADSTSPPCTTWARTT